MANLRTNNLSGEQGQKAIRGSLGFHGSENSTDYLQVGSAGDFNYLHDGTSDWTAEFFVRSDQLNHRQTVFSTGGNSSAIGFACRIMEDGASGGSNGYKVLCQFSRGVSGNYLGFLGGVIDNKDFSHVALVFTTSNKQLAIYVDGQLTNSSDLDGTANGTFGSGNFSSDNHTYAFTIGRENFGNTLYMDSGFISNLRIVQGETVYTAAFTPPTSELTIIHSPTLLCCQDSKNPTQEATGKTITANGNFADLDFVKQQPVVIPKVGVDAGNTFGGTIQQSSEGYMYFPTGRTEERGRGRGLFNGGGGPINTIQYIQIQTEGNSLDFGDLTSARDLMGSAASSVRGVFGGQGSPTYSNTIDFVTISTTANAIDFGDLVAANYTPGALASNIRAVFGGGSTPGDPNTNVMQFVTIATTGDTSDFGDLTVGRRHVGGLSSPTRGVYGAGANPGITDVMDFITIASTGNATDFGNMTVSRNDTAGCSNAIRGLFIGGLQPALLNTIDFITIATTGNAQEFGDLVNTVRYGAGLSNSTRGVFMPGNNATARNTIDFVIIDTTGNAQDFGDLLTGINYPSACSDSHGGLAV